MSKMEESVEKMQLSTFRRSLLQAIALETGGDGDEHHPHGLAVKERVESMIGQEVNHGRAYPNLDTLARKGLIEKTARDKRTNNYALTEKGARYLSETRREITEALDSFDAARSEGSGGVRR